MKLRRFPIGFEMNWPIYISRCASYSLAFGVNADLVLVVRLQFIFHMYQNTDPGETGPIYLPSSPKNGQARASVIKL